ncbi:Hypothetical protein LUCI_4665 [Lucifera butyrica]|uniref:Uncharacterized protein n=1 Tax=Lucifera butyrica TaxID=1351585 RepID=A0A498REE8_9FIRM|nr:Hypothetical protein LUCI_4665 [Lucifera butyrica]
MILLEQLSTFVSVLKALLKYSEEHGDRNISISKLKTLLSHYDL